ncbi:hypothetical protein ES704_01958 [subsurface metagenome]|jgi:hypothetical protein
MARPPDKQDELLLKEIEAELRKDTDLLLRVGRGHWEDVVPIVLAKVKQRYPIMYKEEADFVGWLIDRGWLPPAEVERLKQHYEQRQDIVCPFCGEDDFDKVGLKYHLDTYCKIYQETEVIGL